LSSNNLKQAQSNAVVAQQKEVDRVGFEPTTCGSEEWIGDDIRVTALISLP
jgi:hypothetical protein